MLRKILIGLGAVIILIIIYLLLWPVPINPVKITPQDMPQMSGIFEPNDLLKEIELLAEGHCLTPEDVAFDEQGRMYSSMTELGIIMRFQPDGTEPEVFAETGGKVAGLNFDNNGNLLVANVDKGLMSIAPNGKISVLVDSYKDEKLTMVNDIDVDINGTIYFSQTSTKYKADKMFLDIMEYRPNGRLFAYYPDTKETELLINQLYFANGVTVSPDSTFVLVAQTNAYQIIRYWLKGENKGKKDVFIDNLPGLPDNLDFNDEGICWLAIVDGPDERKTLDSLLPHPYLRKIIARIPLFITQPKSVGGHAFILGLSKDGEIIYNLQDAEGENYNNITSVTEHNGKLYLGTNSHALTGIGVIDKPE